MNAALQPAFAFIATIVLIVMLRPVAFRIHLTDKPGTRKVHQQEMPLIGGIAIYFAVLLTLFWGELGVGGTEVAHAGPIAIGITLLVFVGALDDWRGLSPLIRFVFQVAAGLVMTSMAGVVLYSLGQLSFDGSPVYLNGFAIPFTVFVVVGMINAINMCDGLDGLSGNMTLVSLAGLGVANSIWGTTEYLQSLNIVSAGIVGFLVFNQRSFWLNKAWVFLGDAGSMMLGYMLIWNAIELSQASPEIISPAATLWFVAVPVFDTVTMMLRRVAQGRSPFHADAEHLHHLLVRVGFTVGETIGIMCVLAAIGCLVGIVVTWLQVKDIVVALSFVVTGVLYLILIRGAWQRGEFMGRTITGL